MPNTPPGVTSSSSGKENRPGSVCLRESVCDQGSSSELEVGELKEEPARPRCHLFAYLHGGH